MRAVGSLGVGLLVAISAGCADGSDSAVQPTATSQSTVEPVPLEIPPVTDPLDVSAFVADPCALLDEGQRVNLGLPEAVEGSASCDLHVDASEPDAGNYLRIGASADGGLTFRYAQCDTGTGMDCGEWAMTTIDGYPVIRANDDATSRHGFCRLFVGVADDATVSVVDVRLGLAADEADCGRADRAAAMILTTLRP